VPVELRREEGDEDILLLPGRLEDGPEDREEGPEEEDTGKELSPSARAPVPQGILSPFD
jgi:hypothetical protein